MKRVPDRPDQWHWRDGELRVPPGQGPPGKEPFPWEALGELFKAGASLIFWLFVAYLGLMIVKPEIANKIAEFVLGG